MKLLRLHRVLRFQTHVTAHVDLRVRSFLFWKQDWLDIIAIKATGKAWYLPGIHLTARLQRQLDAALSDVIEEGTLTDLTYDFPSRVSHKPARVPTNDSDTTPVSGS
jgi:hypothetical protein